MGPICTKKKKSSQVAKNALRGKKKISPNQKIEEKFFEIDQRMLNTDPERYFDTEKINFNNFYGGNAEYSDNYYDSSDTQQNQNNLPDFSFDESNSYPLTDNLDFNLKSQ